VRGAFVHGMDGALLVSAGIALAGAVLALLYLPKTNASLNTQTTGPSQRTQIPGPHSKMPG
jgi:hypothetical protein